MNEKLKELVEKWNKVAEANSDVINSDDGCSMGEETERETINSVLYQCANELQAVLDGTKE